MADQITPIEDWQWPEPKRRLWYQECDTNQHYQKGRVYRRTSKSPESLPKRERLKIGAHQEIVLKLIDRNWPSNSGVFMFTVQDVMDLWDIEEWEKQIPHNKDIRNSVVKACSKLLKKGLLLKLADRYVVDNEPKPKTELQIERDGLNALRRKEELERESPAKRAKKDNPTHSGYRPAPNPRHKKVLTEDFPIWDQYVKDVKASLK